jgi:hypothetical protein
MLEFKRGVTRTPEAGRTFSEEEVRRALLTLGELQKELYPRS